jgi:MFS family permease
MMDTSPKFKIPRPLFFLGLASYFTDAASEMMYPLLPLFLTSVVGASFMFVGLVEGVAESTAAYAKYFFGWWSDKTKKRTRFVIGGYMVANTVRPLIGLATAPWQVLALRFTDRIGKGMRTAPRDAWLAGLVPSDMRGRAYGFHRAMDHAGAMTGPLIASAFLFLFPGQLRTLFLVSIVPGLVAAFCILLAHWAHKGTAPVEEKPFLGKPGAVLPSAFKRYLAVIFIFTLGGSSDAFLLLKLSAAGVDGKYIPLLWSALHVVKSSTSLLGGQLADQVGRKPAIVLGWLWYAAIYLALGLVESRFLVIAIFLAYGLYYGLTESAERALVAEMVSPEARGRAFGLQNLMEGLGALPASLLFGFLWKAASPFLAFAVSAAFALAAALLMAAIPLRPKTVS